MKRIKKIINIHRFADDTYIEYEYYPDFNFDISHPVSLYEIKEKSKLIEYRHKIIYDDGTYYILPTSASISPINNNLEFLAIYGEEPGGFSKTKEAPYFFPPPNNAAIYNADGTLRHQLIIPKGADGNYIKIIAGHSTKYPDFITVILDYPDYNKGSWYFLYAIDPDSPMLIDTGQVIRY